MSPTSKVFASLLGLFFLLFYGAAGFMYGRHVERQNIQVIVEPLLIILQDGKSVKPHGDKGELPHGKGFGEPAPSFLN